MLHLVSLHLWSEQQRKEAVVWSHILNIIYSLTNTNQCLQVQTKTWLFICHRRQLRFKCLYISLIFSLLILQIEKLLQLHEENQRIVSDLLSLKENLDTKTKEVHLFIFILLSLFNVSSSLLFDADWMDPYIMLTLLNLLLLSNILYIKSLWLYMKLHFNIGFSVTVSSGCLFIHML